MATSWLWTELRDIFETHDGSLLEIRVMYPNPTGLVAGFALLRGGATELVEGDDACFWSLAHEAELPVDSVPNAAALVVAGKAEPFHVLLRGVERENVVLPDLGVYVFQDQLALDYRQGPEWGPELLEALFRLLGELVALDAEAVLALEEGVASDVIARFHKAWQHWLAELC